MGAPLTLPPPIRDYLTRYVRLRRRHAMLRACGLAACFFLAWGLGCCMIDRVVALAGAARLALLAAGALAVAVIVFRPLAYWLSRDVNWRTAAAEIERHDGRFGQRLRTVTSAWLAPPRHRASREIVEALAVEVGQILTTQHPSAMLRWRPALLPLLGTFGLGLAALALAQLPTVRLSQLAARFVTPLRPIPPVTTTRLTMRPLTTSIVEGQPLRVVVSAERLTRSGVTLYHTPAQGSSSSWTAVPMTPTAEGMFEAVVSPVAQDLRFLARGGDARTAIGHATVLRKPVMTEMRVRYTYPSYTNRATLTVTNVDGLIEAPAGTEAAVTFVASQPLASAVLKVGERTIDTTAGDDPRQRRATIAVEKDQAYSLSMTSTEGVAGSGPAGATIRAIPDRPPLVQVVQPPGELRLSPRDILSLPFQAIDDYGIVSLTTNVQITASGVDATGEPINLAQGKPATQPSTWGGAGADRAVDGKTDGNFLAGSVTHTDATPNPWWQVDLGNVTPVSVMEIWNRADAVPERLSDFFVFVSDGPFLSDDPAAITAQAGVGTYRVAGAAGRPTTIEVFRTARFVRVQLPKTEYLSLAEVRVLQAKPVAAGELASRSFDTNLKVARDPRQQDGEAVLDLAQIKVGVGDVVSVSVTATDSGKHVGLGGPIRVVVSPRSVDQRAYDRINELKRAAQLGTWLVSQLDTAAKSFEPAAARGVGRVDAYVAALASATRELSGVPETSSVLQSALLRCVIRSDSPALSVALAAMIDELQRVSAASSALGAKFAFDSAPTEADRTTLTATAAAARRMTDHIAAILRGEQARAILADLDNLRASEQGTPSAKEAADRARERARRVREDVAAAMKELGLGPGGAEVEAQLKAMVAARQAAVDAYRITDFSPPAQAYAAAMGSRQSLPALIPRLTAAAQAEAIRPDGNLIRARDLQLAASAALRVRDAGEATRAEFIASFGQVVAALQREHATGIAPPAAAPSTRPAAAMAPTTAPATVAVTAPTTVALAAATQSVEAIRAAAADARRKLSLWARGESERSANEAEALRRAQELAMQANADLAHRQYDSAEEADERIVRELRLAERTFPRAADRYEQARQEIRRSTERAKHLDRLAEQQEQLGQGALGQSAVERRAAQEKITAEMKKAAEDEGDVMTEGGADNEGENDSRLAAVNAIRTAQERLAAMPQQLREAETAIGERAAAAARLRQLQQQAMPPDEQAAAARAVRNAEEQLRDAEQRLADRSKPLAESVAAEMSRSLSGFAPDTTDAIRGLAERLRPAMSRLQRTMSAGTDDVGSAVAELRGAIDGLQTQLKDAQGSLLERDPLTAARAYAAAASASVQNDPAAAATNQQSASAALTRAWDVAIHEAAAARLAGLPTMRPLFAPPPDASAAPPQGAADNVAAKFPMFFEWGRLPWRPMQSLTGSPRAADPAGYEDALQAYFEALGVTAPQEEPKK